MRRFGVDVDARRLATVRRARRRALSSARARCASKAMRRRRRISSPPARSAAGRCASRAWAAISIQGDVAFADVLARHGRRRPLRRRLDRGARRRAARGGIDADCNAIPDAAMTLAIVALFAEAPTTLRNIGSWRVKETDRIAAMATELAQARRHASTKAPTGCAVTPPARLQPATIDTYDDHRMAMCFSLAALGGVPVTHQRSALRAQDVPRLFRRIRAPGAATVSVCDPTTTSPPPMPPVIAIDGPAASGKGTIAQGVARGARVPLPRQRLAVPAGRAAGAAAGMSLDDEPRAGRACRRRSTCAFATARDSPGRPGRHRGDTHRGGQRGGLAGRRPPAGARRRC